MAETMFSGAVNPSPGKGELTILTSGYSQTKALHKLGPQVLDYFLVHTVLEGKGRFQCMGKLYELGPGSSFFIFPGELVMYESDAKQPWKYRWIGFKGVRADEFLAQIGISPFNPVVSTDGNRRVPALFHRILKTLQEGGSQCDMRAGGYMRMLLAEYSDNDQTADARQGNSQAHQVVDKAIRWITLHYSRTISIEEMAHALGYHRTHLSRIFKEHTGLSPINYLLQVRMERAKGLLAQDWTIEQVAASVGFEDALYFSKTFRKRFGCSPTEYRMGKQPIFEDPCR